MPMVLNGPVGLRHRVTQVENRESDQAKVIGLLAAIGPDSAGKKGVWQKLPVPLRLGCPPELFAAIWDFQGFWAHKDRRYVQDGVIDPGGGALKLMNMLAPDAVPAPRGAPDSPVPQRPDDGRVIQQTNEAKLADDHHGEYTALSPLLSGGKLYPIKITPSYRNLHFRVRKDGQIFWIGAGVPTGTTNFNQVQIYFHPSPENSGTVHARPQDYPSFTGGWKTRLQNYTGRAGLQIAAARRVAVLIPYSTMASRQGGAADMFKTGGVELINSVMAEIQAICTPANRRPPQVARIGVTSFSNGIDSLKLFLRDIGGTGLIKEITDLDSPYIVRYPKALTRLEGAISRCFSQVPASRPEPGYVYIQPGRFPTDETVHAQIGWQMYMTAMLTSSIF